MVAPPIEAESSGNECVWAQTLVPFRRIAVSDPGLSQPMRRVVLLGPQRFQPCVAPALETVGCTGMLAVVTAGWQEREAEVDELAAHVEREVVHLRLYERAEDALAADPELAAALRQHREELQHLQELYRLRLTHAVRSFVELQERDGPFVADHRRDALRVVRAIDRQHVGRMRRLEGTFAARWKLADRPAIARHRAELRAALDRASALAIAGGHVAVLLNRLRLFDVLELAPRLPIVAWSAGAMALGERVVLFHDDPPQGAGHAEVLDSGLAAYRGVVPLPHATRRLHLGEPTRVALFAQRFAPAVCVPMDGGARLDFDGRAWHAAPGMRSLGARGDLPELRAF